MRTHPAVKKRVAGRNICSIVASEVNRTSGERRWLSRVFKINAPMR